MKDLKLKIKKNILQYNNKQMENQNGNETDRYYYDHINLQHIKYLLSLSDEELLEHNSDETKEERKKHILGLKRLFVTWVNSKKDKHKRTYKMKPCNRYYAVGPGVSFCRANVRNFVCADYCIDYDMSNCHPTIILHLLKINKLPHTFFEQLVNKRDELLEEYGIKKREVLAKLNQDKPKQFPDAVIINEAIKEWVKAKKRIIEIYKDECISKKYTYDENKGNPISSKCSAILCYHENLLLCRCLDKYADKVSVPMYDGFIATSEIAIDELNELTADYGIKWKQKSMDTNFVLGEITDNTNTYEDLKKRFEKECFLLRDSIKFKMFQPHIKEGIKWATKDWKDVVQYYKKFQTFNADGKKCDFMKLYEEDETRLEYYAMDFIPYNSKLEKDPSDKGIFNLFEGFKSHYVEYDDEDVKWFLDFVHTLLNEEGVAQYVINYLAHLVQKPNENPFVALVLKGEKGTGKDTLGMIVENILGTSFMCKGQGMEDIFGNWNDHLANKLVGVMNEVEGKDGIKFMEKLKERIVNPKFSVKEKYMTQKCNMNWIMRLIILSNNYTPVQTDNSDRRFMITRVNDALHGNKDFFNQIYKNINNPEKMNQIFSYLTDVDFKDWVPKDNVPITDTYVNMATRNIPPPRLYLWQYIHNHNKQQSEEQIVILQSLFNREVQRVSEKVLGWTEKMRKKQIKCEMERDSKYVTNKSYNFGKGSGQMAYIINNPKEYIQHLQKFDFKQYNPEAVDWCEYQFIDEDDSENKDDLD
tara:strand:- start:27 stop:2297 length:2271 start_codon:yes stop_codon:yes gene_type:complete